MPRFVALFRAVNVGGTGKLSMRDLASLLERIEFTEVRTLLQSGNAVFDAPAKKPKALEIQIENALTNRLGIQTDVVVRSVTDWRAVIAENPFVREAELDPGRLTAALVKEDVTQESWKSLIAAIRGREIIRGEARHGYIYYPDGQGNSKLTTTLIERKLGTRATIRNWNTVLKIDDALRS